MISVLFRFLFVLPIVCAAFFFQWFLVSGGSHAFLIKSYTFNLVLALIFIGVYLAFKSKIISHLGYYFLYFSLLKFFLFFLVIYPNMDRAEGLKSPSFLAFFVPYVICLTHEIIFISREMNKS